MLSSHLTGIWPCMLISWHSPESRHVGLTGGCLKKTKQKNRAQNSQSERFVLKGMIFYRHIVAEESQEEQSLLQLG